MLTISDALSVGQVQSYHVHALKSTDENYYSAGGVQSEWAGRGAEMLGLSGAVGDDAFVQVAKGIHPATGETMVQWRNGHRAGFDALISAPKSVSLVGLVGGDARVVEAHREAVRIAYRELETFAQARVGGSHPAETTGKLAIAVFHHDSARPVDGYSAPQLHAHGVVMNVTQMADGRYRALQPLALYESQQLITAVYRAELARQLKSLGYAVRRGDDQQPEIVGLTKEYLEAASQRRAVILTALAEQGRSGAKAAHVAALATREAKVTVPPDEMLARHREMAAQYGNQPQRVVAKAAKKAIQPQPDDPSAAARAVDYAIARNIEREAVIDGRFIKRDALIRGMGRVSTERVTDEIKARIRDGALLERERTAGAPAKAFTTPEMVKIETQVVEWMQSGRQRHRSLASESAVTAALAAAPHLNEGQRSAVAAALASQDTVTGLQGFAGVGKTTVLTAVVEAAQRRGYEVHGLAPTGGATDQLAKAGIPATTLQRLLVEGVADASAKRLYVIDESSLVSTSQMAAVIPLLRSNDRVLLVGDTAQHESVDAGRVFAQLQEAGMYTAQIGDIIRQRDPEFRAKLMGLVRGDVKSFLGWMAGTDRVQEHSNQDTRIAAVAREYARDPSHTIVVSPDNDSRARLNDAIHAELREQGLLDGRSHRMTTLIPRQDMTGPDRGWAAHYQIGDVVRYTKAHPELGVAAGGYATVRSVDDKANTLRVKPDGGREVSYSPAKITGVTVYRSEERDFAVGDRVQFTRGDKSLRVRNRDTGIIAAVSDRTMRITHQSGRSIAFRTDAFKHLDRGYAVTTYSVQGSTADNVLFHVDTDRGGGDRRALYVAASRARHNVKVYTNDAQRVAITLAKDRSKEQAIQPRMRVAS